MTDSHREPASRPPAGLRANAGRFPRTGTPIVTLASALAIIAISATAFAGGHLLTAGYHQKAAATRKLCGRAYKLPKPLARQFTFHDAGSKGVRGLAFCGNGSFLAAADGNGHVYLWSMITHRTAWTLHDPRSKGVDAVAYRPRTSTVAAGDANGSVYLWRPGRGRPRRLADHASKGIRALAFSPSGSLLAAADANGRAYVWSMRTNRVVAVLPDPGSKGIAGVAFAADGKTVATGDANGTAYEWTLGRAFSRRLVASLHISASLGGPAVAFRPGARTRTIAIADGNGHDYLWVPGQSRPAVLADPASDGIGAERFTPNGGFLATADADGHLYFWSFSIFKIVELLPAERARGIRAVAFSPDGRRVAAGSASGTIYLADTSRIGISATFGAVHTAG
jgi:WD40 repeat protein